MITRKIEEQIQNYLNSKDNKILFIWGPRRSGKTTLLKKYAKLLNEQSFNFDFISDQEMFVSDRNLMAKLVSEHKVILIDEVQNFPEATKVLKLLHDEFNIKIIATGSSELRQKGQNFESLAGRYLEAFCLPFSIEEIAEDQKITSSAYKSFQKDQLNNFIRWGGYPEVFLATSKAEKIKLLENIFNTFVLKDVVSIYDLKDTRLARDILQKIALQVGNEVSLREIANSLQANIGTVSNYIEIFIKNHILIQLPAFKINLRRAVSENKKYYFLDLGIRNALVKDFRSLDLRPDNGNIFENFIISEIYKKKRNEYLLLNLYFYREYSGRETDLICENYQKQYQSFEIKLTKDLNGSVFPLESKYSSINTKNYFQIIKKFK